MSAIPEIIACRNKIGASTDLGRRLSTMVEQIQNGVSVKQTIAEIQQIQADGGVFVFENHVGLSVASAERATVGGEK